MQINFLGNRGWRGIAFYLYWSCQVPVTEKKEIICILRTQGAEQIHQHS